MEKSHQNIYEKMLLFLFFIGLININLYSKECTIETIIKNTAEGDFSLSLNSSCIGSASSGGNMGDPRRATYQHDSVDVIVTFNVTVPEFTPEEDTIYIVGTLNDWNPGELMMTRVSQNSWQCDIALDKNSSFEYKYTRGSWETVEKDKYGGEIENRILLTDSTDFSVNDEVFNWRDIEIQAEPENISPILSYFNNSPQTSIAITWASDSTAESVLYYGIENVNDNRIVVNEHNDLVENGDSLIHIARLTDLTPNTTYQYKVETAGIFYSDTFSFTTATEETEFTFIVGGDNQPVLVESVLDSIISEPPQFMLNIGDMVVDGNNLNDWYKFLESFREMTGNYVMMPVYGNHEEDSPTMTKLFQFPANGSSDSTNEGHWFSFDYNNIHIIGLDIQRDFAPDSEQYNWLQNDLQSIGESIDHRIVYLHEPAYNSTGSHGPNLRVRQYLEPLFIEYDVDMVFAGHNHFYERSMVNGIAYITTGGLGTDLKDFNPDSNPWSVYVEKINHYCRIRINGTYFKVEMVRQDGSIGDVYESFKIDGKDSDWLTSGVKPLLDTDHLQTDSELKLERFYINQDKSYFYFGFDVPAKDKGISYGIYIDVDNIPGSGGASDCWGKAVIAENDHLPEIEIYAYHGNDDTWSSSSPKYYSWDNSTSDWVIASGGMGSLPEGGIFAVDTISRFFEMAIPKDAPGFDSTNSFFVELFTVGESSGAGASESIPSDSTIQFIVENSSTDVTVLTAFHGFNVTTTPPPDLNPIKIDGSQDDWIALGIEPLATDTDKAQQDTEYKMDSLYVLMDSINVYFGFQTPAEYIGLHYGIYIDTDSLDGSGGTSDKWGCGVTAVNNRLPDVTIYAYHSDDGGWSGSSPKYYTWSGSDWIDYSGGEGSLPPGGRFAHNPDLDFVEILIPRTSPGFENVTYFYISLFNFGSKKYVCETVPSDPAVSFAGENTSTSIELSSFALYQETIVSVENSNLSILPVKFLLNQNYPNPFNQVTRINYSLDRRANISIKVYDLMGRLVTTLVNESLDAGTYEVLFDGKNLTSGIYFYQLTSGNFQISKKLMLNK